MKDSTAISMSNRTQKIGQIVKDYGNRLFGFIRGKVGSNEDAEDILQEVWFQLSNSVNVWEIEQMSGWLFKVANNKIIDKYRKPKREIDFVEEDESFFLKQFYMEISNDRETDFLERIFWKELFHALDELPEKQREVFILNELEDMTLQEIADKTGTNLKTIISRKGYAVKHIRKKLLNLYNEFFIN